MTKDRILLAILVLGLAMTSGRGLMRLVMKFGGTSVSDGQRIRDVAAIIHGVSAKQGHPIVTAISAMSGVTDALIRSARRAAEGDSRRYVAAHDR